MRPITLLCLPVLLLAGCIGATVDNTAAVNQAAAGITDTGIRDRIAFLASDELRGRDTPSPELDRAAQYIEDEFRSFGLQPGGDQGSFKQIYPLQRRALSTEGAGLEVSGSGSPLRLAHGTDFVAYAGVPDEVSGPVTIVLGEIDAESAAQSLDGRIAVARLPGAAMSRDVSRVLNQQRAAAKAAGAAGVIFVLDEGFPAQSLGTLAEQNARPGRMQVGEVTDIPAFLLSNAAVQRIKQQHGVDLAVVRDDRADKASGEFVTVEGSELSVKASAPVRIFDDFRAPNVVAVLPGSDRNLRDTYVVFSAHFDHVGVGRPDASGDSIYNGADDNASGTSGLLEVARAFASLPRAPARSLVFLAVSAEEKGLLGSQYFSDHPTVPIEKIVANINVDMIGRNSPDSIVVIGQEYSTLGPLVQEVAAANPELGLTVAQDIWPEQRFFFRSDHYNFARKDIPALFFFAGVHEDYHRPSDHVERIDADKAARVARLVFYTAYEIASRADAPEWTEEGLREVRAMVSGGR